MLMLRFFVVEHIEIWTFKKRLFRDKRRKRFFDIFFSAINTIGRHDVVADSQRMFYYM